MRVRYAGETAPRITQHPASVTLLEGQSVTFTVIASGASPLRYQWRRNGVAIAGETAASYRFSAAKLSDSGASFDVVVTNTLGTATSNAAVLTVTSNTRPRASLSTSLAMATPSPAEGFYLGGMRMPPSTRSVSAFM